MAHLTQEARKAIVEKALTRTDQTLSQIAEESNIGYSTLSRWLRQTRQGLLPGPTQRVLPAVDPAQTSPLQHLLAAEKLDEKGVGSYCREQGIHSFQLKQWREELMKNNTNKKQSEGSRKKVRALRDEIKNLKKELRYKDKALAETSALLVLKKKANLIWGELEDD